MIRFMKIFWPIVEMYCTLWIVIGLGAALASPLILAVLAVRALYE